MKSLFFIAKRYIFLSKKTRAINILSLITMTAMSCGAAALMIVLSTFNGFESLAVTLYESFQPNLVIESKINKTFRVSDMDLLKIKKIPEINSFSKVIEEKAYFKYGDKEALGVLKGVDSNYFKTTDISKFILAGDSVLENEETSFALLGAGIGEKLGVGEESGLKSIEVYAPKSSNGIGIGMLSNFELSYLVPNGIFSIYQEFDEKYIIAPINMVQYLFQLEENSVSAIEIKTETRNEDYVKKELLQIFGNQFIVKNRLESNETLYRITKIEKMMVILIMTFILLILSFNFIGSLTMHIIEKTHDIKILKFLGLTSIEIQKLYLLIGLLQGVLGGLIGMIIGYLICIVQQVFGIVKMPGNGTFVVNAYPVEIHFIDMWVIFSIIVLISLLASIYPSFLAKKIK